MVAQAWHFSTNITYLKFTMYQVKNQANVVFWVCKVFDPNDPIFLSEAVSTPIQKQRFHNQMSYNPRPPRLPRYSAIQTIDKIFTHSLTSANRNGIIHHKKRRTHKSTKNLV